MIYLLLWLLSGSIGLNIIYIMRHRLLGVPFYFTEICKSQSLGSSIKDLAIGLLIGPFSIFFGIYIMFIIEEEIELGESDENIRD